MQITSKDIAQLTSRDWKIVLQTWFCEALHVVKWINTIMFSEYKFNWGLSGMEGNRVFLSVHFPSWCRLWYCSLCHPLFHSPAVISLPVLFMNGGAVPTDWVPCSWLVPMLRGNTVRLLAWGNQRVGPGGEAWKPCMTAPWWWRADDSGCMFMVKNVYGVRRLIWLLIKTTRLVEIYMCWSDWLNIIRKSMFYWCV